MIISGTEAFIGGISALFTSLVILITGLRWIYRKGKADQALIGSLNAITRTNEKLTAQLAKLEEKTEQRFHNHELRMVWMESRFGNRNGRPSNPTPT